MFNFFCTLTTLAATLGIMNSLQADTTIWLGTGWRSDDFSWSIGLDSGPNVISELDWSQIRMIDIAVGIKGNICEDWYYRINGDYGKIYHGKNRDTDYYLDNQKGRVFQADNKADKGEAFDINLGLGYPLFFCKNAWQIIPIIGYSRMEQHLVMRKGYITYSIFQEELGKAIHGLNSRYNAEWSTLWFGIDFLYEITCGINFYGTLEYHRAFYKASGDWNLRDDFIDDFKHDADGNGFVGILGANYSWMSGLGIGLEVGYKFFKTQKGTEETKMSATFYEGIKPVTIKTRLNEVEWRSFRILGNVTYDF